jgi:uncharacterized membrane protein HdeD (DUF308 family)
MEIMYMPSRGALLVRALVNIILGALVIAWPGITLLVVIFLFALNFLITGLFMVFEPAFDKQNNHAALTVIFGVVLAIVGLFLLGRPQLTGDIIVLLVAVWALFFGMVDLYVGVTQRKEQPGTWLLIIVSFLALIFGIYLLFNPLTGILAFVWVIGLYALVSGIVLGILALFAYPKAKGKN